MTSISSMEGGDNQKPKWKFLSKSVMELNEKNYAELSNIIVTELQSLLQVDSDLSSCNNITVLYILYERALRELVTSSFPVSANIIDALSNSSDVIFEIIQKLMRIHFQELLKKLNDCLPLSCNDIGVVYLLLSIYRLDKVSGRHSSLISIIEMIIKQVSIYIKTFSDFPNLDILVMILYALIHYCLLSAYENNETKQLVNFIRKVLIKYADSVSNFAKVLAVDVLEQSQDKSIFNELYAAIYKKIFQPELFIIPGLSKFINDLPCPDNDSVKYNGHTMEDKGVSKETNGILEDHKEGISNGWSTTKEEKFENATSEENKSAVNLSSLPELEDGEIVSDEEKVEDELDVISPPEESKPALKWSMSVIQTQVSVKKTETITVPAKCIGRVIGFEGAIARKLEFESNAVIEVGPVDEIQRPATSCLTAHRLVTGCLGIPVQLQPEQVEEEKYKLSEAKIRRQTEGRQEKLQSINITGCPEEIKHAYKLINDILTCVVTIHIPLDFTVDEILDRYSGKLKTIEMLLNVFLEVEEQEDEKVIINISGDEQSCQDAKKLIFEELGSFRSQHGHLFVVPEEMMKVLENEEGLSSMVETVQQITHARIIYLLGPKGFAIFISGYLYQVNRSLQIFQKTNSELLCCLSDTSDKTNKKDKLNTECICEFIVQSFGDMKRKDSNRPSLLRKETTPEKAKMRLVYTKESLLELASAELSKGFPKMISDDPNVQIIILDSRHSTESVDRLMNR